MEKKTDTIELLPSQSVIQRGPLTESIVIDSFKSDLGSSAWTLRAAATIVLTWCSGNLWLIFSILSGNKSKLSAPKDGAAARQTITGVTWREKNG